MVTPSPKPTSQSAGRLAKVLGLISGAAIAAGAITAFNIWRHVSDDDRLTEALAEHCLPYVRTGAAPFAGMGRTPGVYDEVEINDTLTEGAARLVYDARFVAQWGIVPSGGPSGGPDSYPAFRVCTIDPTYGANTVAGFVVDADRFASRYTAVIAPDGDLIPDFESLTQGPVVVGWYNASGEPGEGLRVVMTASPGLVSSVLVGTNLPE